MLNYETLLILVYFFSSFVVDKVLLIVVLEVLYNAIYLEKSKC